MSKGMERGQPFRQWLLACTNRNCASFIRLSGTLPQARKGFAYYGWKNLAVPGDTKEAWYCDKCAEEQLNVENKDASI